MSMHRHFQSVVDTSRREVLIRAAQLGAMASLPRWAWSGNARPRHDPFGLGVASGDPSPDGFVLWTRLLPPDAPPPLRSKKNREFSSLFYSDLL